MSSRSWVSLASAAVYLGLTPTALRRTLERRAVHLPDGSVEAEVDGVRARKFGRLWRVRFDDRWLPQGYGGQRYKSDGSLVADMPVRPADAVAAHAGRKAAPSKGVPRGLRSSSEEDSVPSGLRDHVRDLAVVPVGSRGTS